MPQERKPAMLPYATGLPQRALASLHAVSTFRPEVLRPPRRQVLHRRG
jgi:hypothetical protein